MSKPRNGYRVYLHETGELIAEGTAAECAVQRGVAVKSFHSTVSQCRAGKNKRFDIQVYRLDEPLENWFDAEKKLSPLERAQARIWDAFCRPIRKRNGIAVRRFV